MLDESYYVTTAVVRAMQELYPLEYADSSWDNVGLLLDNLPPPASVTSKPMQPRVLLTNDLTSDVVDEAIENGVTTIVAYHPIIFRGLKSVTTMDRQQTSLLRLVQQNISVYSPHTALDAAQGGINDWLIQKVCDAAREQQKDQDYKPKIIKKVAANPASLREEFAQPIRDGLVGYGRKVHFHEKNIHVGTLIRRFVELLNGYSDAAAAAADKNALRHVLVAAPRQIEGAHAGPSNAFDAYIDSVAVCAGSGFDILRTAAVEAMEKGRTGTRPPRTIGMFITGEVSHHEALWATENGIWVVCLLHSNSERRFLAERLREQLEHKLNKVFYPLPKPVVLVSERDRDPFQIWDTTTPFAYPGRPNNDQPIVYSV